MDGISILYQNTRTGAVHDITPLVCAASWSTKRSGTPAKLELTALSHAAVAWESGGILALRERGRGIFYGYAFQLSSTEAGRVSVTAYDQTRYLKNKDTYVFNGKRADEIAAQIAADFKLKTGAMADTGYAIPSMVEDNQTLFDILLKALDLTLVHTGKLFYLWDDSGSLRISLAGEPRLDLLLGDGSLASGYTYGEDIDGGTYNRVKLARDNKASGKRDVYLFQDSKNIAYWGVLQDYEKVDENLNEAQIKARGEQMLELYNRPRRTLELSALSDLRLRAGRAVYIRLEAIGVSQFYLVEEAEHNLLQGVMRLKLAGSGGAV